jgi:hypothetical protein
VRLSSKLVATRLPLRNRPTRCARRVAANPNPILGRSELRGSGSGPLAPLLSQAARAVGMPGGE